MEWPTIHLISLTVSSADSVLCLNVGLDEKKTLSNLLKVYPNPNTGVFSIHLTMNQVERIQLEIFNILGQTIFQEVINPSSGKIHKELNLSHYPAGIYNLRIQTSNEVANRQIIIE